jgi:hypothetical protein
MDNYPRKPGITRLVVSGGKRAEPRLMMAHPKRNWHIGEALTILIIVAFAVIVVLVR